MKNKEIINNALLSLNLDPKKTVVKTVPEWNRLHYQIKQGEKELFKAKIWKPIKKTGFISDKKDIKMIRVQASFFSLSQVVKQTRVEKA